MDDKIKLLKQDIMIAVIDYKDWNPAYRYDLLKEIESLFLKLDKQPKLEKVE